MNKKLLLTLISITILFVMAGCGTTQVDLDSPLFATATPTSVSVQPTTEPITWTPSMGVPEATAIESCQDGETVDVTTYRNNQPYRIYSCADVREWARNFGATPIPGKTPSAGATATSVAPACDAPASSYAKFDPATKWDWNKLGSKPTMADFLKAHNLKDSDIQKFDPQSVSWEPAMYVVEFTPDLYGKVKIQLLEGYVYTLALTDDTVEVIWGGDPNVKTACLQWGFTARWVKDYQSLAYKWLNPADPRELAAREYRFGRYLRSDDMQGVRQDVPYFQRFGPYYTGVGNLDTRGWVPPAIDASVPRNYMDACAMLGGLCNESEWKFGEKASGGYLNWSWKYSAKVPGSATYCHTNMPCWQTVYVPDGSGYVEIWLSAGTTGPDGKAVGQAGPYKFYADDRAVLADGKHNVDEFSYHADPTR